MPAFTWWTTDALVKVRPLSPAMSLREVPVLRAARNEFEAFQIVLRSDIADVADVDVAVSDFVGRSGSISSSDNVTIYFERFLNLSRPSNLDGEVGEWPDPLVPRVDRYSHERRNAFPFTLHEGRNQPLWVEVYVPLDAGHGSYHALATVRSGGEVVAEISITLEVWDFDLPSTSSLKTAFGFNGVTALKQHRGGYTSDDDFRAISQVYVRSALLHRVSALTGPMNAPPFSFEKGVMVVDWSLYDRDIGVFLDGTGLSSEDPLPGAQATSVEMRTPGGVDTDERRLLYWREWARHFSAKGWLDRLFSYLPDEPTAGQIPEVYKTASLAHAADGRLRNLVTSPLRADLEGPIDIWSPVINCFETKPGWPEFCSPTVPRAAYEQEQGGPKALWWYQSCASHGCDIVGGAYFSGWPSYAIDAASVSNRIMPWMSWKYGVEGELYYSMVESYGLKSDPLTDVFLHGGNGDGTLFYPGRPAVIGGTTQIPIESLRLKLIRDGLEDYEYLVLLAGLSDRGTVVRWVDRIVQNTYTFDSRPEALYQVRRELGDEIEARLHTVGRLN